MPQAACCSSGLQSARSTVAPSARAIRSGGREQRRLADPRRSLDHDHAPGARLAPAASRRPSSVSSASRSSSTAITSTLRRPPGERQTARGKIVGAPTMRARSAGGDDRRHDDRPERTAMSTAEAERPQDGYALGRTPQEYERLRAQARVWESATGRLFDQVALAPGATLPGRRLRPGRDDAADGPARRAVGPRHRRRRRRAAGRAGGGDAARRRPSPVRLRTRRPDRRRAGSRRPVRPRLRPAAALPPAAAGRGAANGCGTPSRPAATCSCRTTTCAAPACCPRSRASTSASASWSARSRPPAATCASAPACRSCSRRRGSARPTARTSPDGSSRSPTPNGMFTGRIPFGAADRDRARHHHRATRRRIAGRDRARRPALPRPARPVAAADRRLEAQARPGGVARPHVPPSSAR